MVGLMTDQCAGLFSYLYFIHIFFQNQDLVVKEKNMMVVLLMDFIAKGTVNQGK